MATLLRHSPLSKLQAEGQRAALHSSYLGYLPNGRLADAMPHATEQTFSFSSAI